MRPLRAIGGKRCWLCNRVWAPNQVVESTTVRGVRGWICRKCVAAIEAGRLVGRKR